MRGTLGVHPCTGPALAVRAILSPSLRRPTCECHPLRTTTPPFPLQLLREGSSPTSVGDPARLLTVIGPGEVCKTGLAPRVAKETREQFPAGVAFVTLAPLRDQAPLQIGRHHA